MGELYQCITCKTTFTRSSFEDIDFKWKSHPKEWKKIKNQKINKDTLPKSKVKIE